METNRTSDLPSGTLALLFTDIEGSTVLVDRVGASTYADIQQDHNRLLRTAFSAHGGHLVDIHGDSLFVVFRHIAHAAAGAVQALQDLADHPWPGGLELRARMGLHVGEPLLVAENYVGVAVNRAARICAAGHGGQVLLSEVAWSVLREDPPADVSAIDLGVYRLKDLSRPQALFQLIGPGLGQDFPMPRALEAARHNLPIQTTSFVGRRHELGEIHQLLDERRMVTLVGAGGTGKTRLALQLAADRASSYPDGVWVADLAPLSDASLVASSIAAALQVSEQPLRTAEETLVDHLRDRHLLIVLDNCDHVVGACANLVSAIQASAAHVTIVATSREILRVSGEVAFEVPPLAVDVGDADLVAAADLLGTTLPSEAVQLFMDRASDARPGLAFTEAASGVLEELCRRLDGIPLAIELAAARVRHLSADEILVRLNDRFRLLSSGSRSAPDRHQTLRASIEWCHGLLSPAEQLLFRRLAVFRGGCTLAAAEGVCADDDLPASDVLDALAQLVDRSLVTVRETGSGYRYRFLETIREYAHERLEESAEAQCFRDRHLVWFRRLAESAEVPLSGPDQVAWLARLDAEHDNFRTALQWCAVSGGACEDGLVLMVAITRWWDVRTYWSEGLRLAEPLVQSSAGDARPIPRAKALNTMGQLVNRTGERDAAREYHEQALALARPTSDKTVIAASLRDLGVVALESGDLNTARALEEESLDLRRQIGDPLSIAVSLNTLGTVALQSGDLTTAQKMLEESLSIKRDLADARGVAISLLNLATIVAQRDNNFSLARAYVEESLVVFRELDDKRSIAHALNNLAVIASEEGDLDAARLHNAEAMTIYQDSDDRFNVAETLVAQAELALSAHDRQGARNQLVEALAIYHEIGDENGITYVANLVEDAKLDLTDMNKSIDPADPDAATTAPSHETDREQVVADA